MSEVVTYLDSEAFFVFKMRAKLASVLRLATPDWDSTDGVKLMAFYPGLRQCQKLLHTWILRHSLCSR